jgi:hypothetical protein
MLQSLILIDVVVCLFGKKRKRGKKKEKGKKKKEMARGLFFLGLDTPCWLCCVGFLQQLGAIKG